MSPSEAQRCGDIAIDPAARSAIVDGRAVQLTERELMLLHCFVTQPNRLLTRSELVANAWNMRRGAGSNMVDVIVCRLRRKLASHGPRIETVHGLGYRFRAPVPAPSAARSKHAAGADRPDTAIAAIAE